MVEGTIRTLAHWKSRLTAVPSWIECPEMRLLTGRDHEPPVFVGPGRIELKSTTAAAFHLFASAQDNASGILKVHLAHANPYERLDQFRLFATDFEGTEWACGWIVPRVEQASSAGTLLTGKISSLTTRVSAEWVSPVAGVELLFQPSFHIPMVSSMLTVHSIADEEIGRSWRVGRHTLELLGSRIEFAQDPSDDLLWITANTSAELPHLYLENWLGEPLRILLGQLHYPRLVARNFGDSSAFISIRQSPTAFRNASIGSLLASELMPSTERFWELYVALLTVIAKDRDKEGHPNLEAHRITRFYEEIIQASQGSRWVWCLTLASAAEALAKMLMRPEDQQAEFPAADLRSIKEAVSAWKGDKQVKSRVLNSISLLGRKSVAAFLRDLVKGGAIELRHEDAWNKVRNNVMHGNLVMPWSSKEEDENIIALAELVHTLTREIAKVSRSSSKPGKLPA
jgi:hypothetical protein